MPTTADYGEVTVTIRDFFAPMIAQQAFNARPAWAVFSRNRHPATGNGIVQALATATTTLAGSVSRTGTWSAGLQDQFARAAFDWRFYRSSMLVNQYDLALASGTETSVANYFMAKTKQTSASLEYVLANDLHGDGSAGTNTAIEGFAAALTQSTNPAVRNYGGIDRSVAGGAYWRSTVDDTANGVHTLAMMRNTKGDAEMQRQGEPGGVDLIVTPAAGYDSTWNLIQPLQRFTNVNTEAMARIGFTSLAFEDAAVVRDNAATANSMVFIDSRTWVLYYIPSFWLHTEGPIMAQGNPNKEWVIWEPLCPVCSSPRQNSRRTNITWI